MTDDERVPEDPPVDPLIPTSGQQRPEAAPALSGRQRAIVEALQSKDAELSSMYLGSLCALADDGNPDRHPQAAHSLREIMQNLPRHLDVGVPPRGASLGDKARNLIDAWGDRASCPGTGDPVDKVLAAFLQKFLDFVSWHRLHQPQQKVRAAAIIFGLDPTRVALPAPIRESRAEEWRQCQSFFVQVAHHGGGWSEADFMQWVAFFEEMLIGYLQPQTFAEWDEIDALIAEGEGRAE